MPAAHLVDFASQVESEHHFPAAALGLPVDHAHHRTRAFVERTARSIRLLFIVLDKVDAGLAQRVDQFRGLQRRETNRRFDDGVDERPFPNAGESARSIDAESWSTVGVGEASGNRTSRMRRPENCFCSNRFPATVAMRFGSDGPIFSSGQESVVRAVTRCAPPPGAPEPGRLGGSTAPSTFNLSTLAADLA